MHRVDSQLQTHVPEPVAEQSSPGPTAKGKFVRRAAIISAVAIVVALAAAYAIGAVHWSQRFWPGTTLDGVDLSGVVFADAAAMFQEDPDEAMLTVTDKDAGTEDVIRASDIGYGTDYEGQLEALKSGHDPLSWVLEVLGGHGTELVASSSYDEEKLAALVHNLECMKAEPVKAEDAKLEYKDGKFEITKEVYGTEISEQVLEDAVLDAVANDVESIEVSKLDDIYLQPAIKADDKVLTGGKAKGEKMLSAVQTWKVDGGAETISSDDIAIWLSLDDGNQPILDHDAVRAWWREIGKKYDHDANSLKNFQTSGGSVIDVSGGDWKNGGRATDEDAMSAASIEAIEAGEPQTRDFIWARGGSEADGGLGGTYIEISIAAQHVWYYENGALAYDYACVTGKPDGRHDTPTGIYYIKDQATDYEMVGDDEDGDGKEDYRTTCNYWSRITWSGVGIHDLYHPSYGGSRYLSNGSHGCINSPLDAARYIYNNVDPGTPVVIY